MCQCENTTDREQPPGHNIGNFAHYARWRVEAITKAIHTCDLIILLYNCLLFLIFGPGGRRRQFVLLKMKQRAAPRAPGLLQLLLLLPADAEVITAAGDLRNGNNGWKLKWHSKDLLQ